MAVTKRTECFKLVRRIQGFCLTIILLLCTFLWRSAEANPHSCETAKQHFLSKGYAATPGFGRPTNGDVCGANSCCGTTMEAGLIESSRLQLDKFLKDTIYRVSSLLDARAKRFDEFFRNMMTSSKRSFHEMFKQTYGVIYLQHSFVFSDFFEELEQYYNKGRVRLPEVLDNFFSILYQRMFTVINSQHQFNDRYLVCVAEHMTALKPFGDVPHKLGIQLKRAFVATRAFYKALTTAADVAHSMAALTVNEKCGLDVVRMQHCDKCLEIQSPGSCSSYCISVLQTCLQQHVALDAYWNNFVDALDKIADRILGPFNIEMVVEPINIKISEAVMTFQENGPEVSQKIFSGCGKPPAQRRRRDTSTENSNTEQPRVEARKIKNAEDEITFESLDFNPNSNKKKRKKVESVASLEKLIKDIKQKVKDSRQFWSQLPYQYCNNEAAPPNADGKCWNGTEIGSFDPQSQSKPIVAPSTPVLNRQIFILQALISKLQSAYQGQDVDLADDSEDTPNISGSGSGMEEFEGSADREVEVRKMPPVETESPRPPPTIPTSTQPSDASQGSSTTISGPTLAKALAHYVLPIVLVWFGGAFSDILL